GFLNIYNYSIATPVVLGQNKWWADGKFQRTKKGGGGAQRYDRTLLMRTSSGISVVDVSGVAKPNWVGGFSG
ncbi:MAG: hypothetical protein ACC645_13100, partial [Pirellulales bacterium]